MLHRFHHEEQREAANEYWGRREAERHQPFYFGPLPPVVAPPTYKAESLAETLLRYAREDEIKKEIQQEENARTYSLEELGLGHLRK